MRVEIDCDKPLADVYVAKGVVDTRQTYPDPFVKVGRAPLSIQLPGGIYTVLVEGQSITSASTVFEVRGQPVHVHARPGSQGMRDLGTLFVAVGVAATVAAAVVQLSRAHTQDTAQRDRITIPLWIGGGVTLVSGFGLLLGSSSKIESDGFAPPSAGWNIAPGAAFSGTF